MIADRHPLVVRQQRVVRPEHPADIGRVEHGGVEVGVVADRGGQEELRIRHRHEGGFGACAARTLVAAACGEQPRGRTAQRRGVRGSERHQPVERRLRSPQPPPRAAFALKNARPMRRRKVEDPLPDGNPAARPLARGAPAKYAERQVLDGKSALSAVGRRDPAPPRGIVRLVEGRSRRSAFELLLEAVPAPNRNPSATPRRRERRRAWGG